MYQIHLLCHMVQVAVLEGHLVLSSRAIPSGHMSPSILHGAMGWSAMGFFLSPMVSRKPAGRNLLFLCSSVCKKRNGQFPALT